MREGRSVRVVRLSNNYDTKRGADDIVHVSFLLGLVYQCYVAACMAPDPMSKLMLVQGCRNMEGIMYGNNLGSSLGSSVAWWSLG